MPRWEGGGGVGIKCFSNIPVMLTRPAIGVETLGYLETCLNCVWTFIFLFLNLFSEVPGGLRLGATDISYTVYLCHTGEGGIHLQKCR